MGNTVSLDILNQIVLAADGLGILVALEFIHFGSCFAWQFGVTLSLCAELWTEVHRDLRDASPWGSLFGF